MRTFLFAILLALVGFGGGFAYLAYEAYALQNYCSDLPLKSSTAQVRESAQEAGFHLVMDPFTQMRITLPIWDPLHRSCRVFFNADKLVEYRSWQEGS